MKISTGNKILWKRGEIAPKDFSSFPQYFEYISNLVVKLDIHLWNVVVRFIFSSVMQILYVEVRISGIILESPLGFEITRVDCSDLSTIFLIYSHTLLTLSIFSKISTDILFSPENWIWKS